MSIASKELIRQYYDSFNRQDMEQFFGYLAEDVVHDINQGKQEIGRSHFIEFMQRMNACYEEEVTALEILVSEDGSRAAAEFVIVGKYLTTDPGLPEAHGQTYEIKCGAFFAIKDGKITRVSNYYNLQDWLKQIAE